MSTLHRAILKTYDPANHKADVQLAQSVPTNLTAVPVATDIPPAECVAGRECAVLLFDDNPDNAVVVTVHGAVPAPAAAGDNIHDTDGNTYVRTEQNPNEDKVRAGAGGVERWLMQTISPHHTFTGDAVTTGQAAISAPATSPNHLLTIGGGGTYGGKIGLHVGLGSSLAGGPGNITGVGGYCILKDPADTNAFGLDYIAGIQGQNAATAVGVRAQIYAGGSGKLITDAYDFIARSPGLVLGNVTNIYGFYAETLNAGVNRRHPFYDAGTTGSGNNRGNVFKTSTQFFKDPDFGSGDRVIGIGVAQVVPTTNPSGGFVLYVDPADNRLKARGSLGTVTVLANP